MGSGVLLMNPNGTSNFATDVAAAWHGKSCDRFDTATTPFQHDLQLEDLQDVSVINGVQMHIMSISV